MIHVTADSRKFTLPGSWSEMTLGQFFKYIETTNDAETLSVLSGVDLAELKQLRAPDLTDLLTGPLSFLLDEVDFKSLPVPTVLAIDDKVIVPPMNLGEQTTFGQKADIDQIRRALTEEGTADNYLTMARPLLSTYLFPLIAGQRYENTNQAESILPIIDNLPCTDALPLSAFFLSKLNQTMISGRLSYKVHPAKKMSYLKKLLLKLKGLKNMIHILRSGKLPKPIA